MGPKLRCGLTSQIHHHQQANQERSAMRKHNRAPERLQAGETETVVTAGVCIGVSR